MPNPLKVLIIEDNSSDALLMVRELEQAGFELEWRRLDTKTGYLDALEEVTQPDSSVDVILADFELPHFDALHALDLLRERELDIPFIVVTGHLDEEIMVKCIQRNVDDFLIKDRLGRLGSAVEHALEQKRLREEKIQADVALRESEERYRRLVELSPDGIAIHSEGMLVFVNDAGAKILRAADPTELIGKPVRDFVHPDYQDITLEQASQIKAGQPTPPIEEKLIGLDGSVIDVEVAATPFTYQGQPAVQVVFRDISKRKAAEAEIIQRQRELTALQYAGAIIATSLDVQDVLDTVTQEMVNLLDVEACIISEWDETANKVSPIATYGMDDAAETDDLDRDVRAAFDSKIKRVLAEEQAQQLGVDQPDLDPTHLAYLKANNIKTLLMLPMKFQDRVVGLVEVRDTHNEIFFTDEEIRLAQLLANQAAAAIQNARLHEETERRAQQLAALRELDRAISVSLRLDDIYRAIANHTSRLFAYDRMSIALRDKSEMRVAYVNGKTDSVLPPGSSLPLRTSAVGWVAMQGQPLLRHNIAANMNYAEDQLLVDLGLSSVMIIPLRIKGEVIGTWEIAHEQIAAYDPDELQAAQSMADQLSVALENARLYQQARQEIAERKHAEEALRQSEERFRQVISSISDHIYVTRMTDDNPPDNIYISPNVEDLTGYPAEEFVADWRFWPSSVIHPEDRAIAAAHAALLSEGREGEVEYRLIRADGNVIWVRDSGRVETDGDSRIVYGVVGDITERKYRERELEVIAKVATALRTVITRTEMLPIILDQLLNLLPVEGVAIEMFDADSGEGIIELARGAWADAVGTRTRQDDDISEHLRVTGQPYVNNQAPSDPYLQQSVLVGNLQAVACVPLIVQEQFIGILWIGRNTDLKRDVVDLLSAVGNIAANALYRATLFEALQRSNKELEQERASLAQRVEERTAELSAANAELARAARLKDEFLASMSHELRTPLNAILGMAEVLRMNVYGQLNDEQLNALNHIEDSGRHLLALINDILDLSKIEANKLELEIRPVVIDDVCQASLRFIQQLAHKKKIKVSFTSGNAPNLLQADERRLKQILVNLLSNAVKFTPEKGQVGLKVKGDEAQQVVQFTVWDTGIGISEEEMTRLFRPFVQIDSSLSRRHGGTGLGLSLVYRLTEMHGGSVAVESEVDQGSQFTVTLPRQTTEEELPRPDDDSSARMEETERLAVSANGQQAAVVLLAEDNETNISTVRDFLQAKGYRVIVAWNGSEAIERAKADKPDIILMDIQMPKLDGLEATRRLREDAEVAKIPIVALTALAMPGDRERCLSAGADEYLSKPISLRKLVKIIEAQLQRTKN